MRSVSGVAIKYGSRGKDAPVGDVVVLALLAVQVPLDGVPAVVKHEDDRLKAPAHHDGQFLDRQLAVEHETQHSSAIAPLDLV